MTRSQLEHVIRAAAANADVAEIVVIGSQAILGSFPDAPPEVLISMEADVYPKDNPASSILIEGAIGERSIFHSTFGYYAHGVDATTAILPAGWKSRLVPICNENTRGATGWCLEAHDLAISKLAAGREKDLNYVAVLLRSRLVTGPVLSERLSGTDFGSPASTSLARDRLARLASNQLL